MGKRLPVKADADVDDGKRLEQARINKHRARMRARLIAQDERLAAKATPGA